MLNRLCLPIVLVVCSLLTPFAVLAEEAESIPLPKPQTEGGKPLMQALKERKTSRDFLSDKLPAQVLSDLLWAGFGINRPENAHRTAPSAMNAQEIDIYVATAEGVTLYDAKSNALLPVLKQDVRDKTGKQAYVKIAPVTLIYVADASRQTKAKPSDREKLAFIDAGFIAQNVYLFCASANLACVVHELDRQPLHEALKLKPDQQIIITQSLGYPKNVTSNEIKK